MLDWIDKWYRQQAISAFERGEAATLKACAELVLQSAPQDNELWRCQGEALYQTRQWYDAVVWAHRWQQASGHLDASLLLARCYAAVQLYPSAYTILTSDVHIEAMPVAQSLLQLLRPIVGDRSPVVSDETLEQLLNAFVECQQNKDDEGLSLIGEKLLNRQCRDDFFLQALGLAHWRRKREQRALDVLLCVQNLTLDCLRVISQAQLHGRQFEAAKATTQLWLEHDDDGLAFAILARCEMALGGSDTESLLAQGIVHFPRQAELWKSLGGWLMHQKNPYRMRDLLRQLSTGDESQNADLLTALALAENRCGANIDVSIQLYLHTVNIDPDAALAWKNLGICYFKLGHFEQAKQAFLQAARAKGDQSMVWSELGMAYYKLLEYAEAQKCILKAIALKPDHVDAWNNLGTVCLATSQNIAALTVFERMLKVAPKHPQARSNLSIALANLARFDEARALYESVLAEKIDPSLSVPSNLLFIVNYDPDLQSEQIYQIYRSAVDTNYPSPRYRQWTNQIDEKRKLRIAYVSPDFRQHPCYHFIKPLLSHHNHNEFTVIAYSNVLCPDQKTAELRACCDEWHDVSTLDDDAIAEKIFHDKIDILIDLTGHTAENLLDVFALKPAPIQMTWLGFGYTTGLKQIDYFLTDEEMYPPGAESIFSEQAARISVPCFAYEKPNISFEVNELPALKNGYITFGSLSRPIRLNHRCLAVWRQLLHAVPNSHLVLNCHAFSEPAMVDLLRDYFVSDGIEAERLDIASESPPWKVFQRIDIALDCFPHNSGTTLFEGLYMGIPFITRRDRISMGRLGATIARGIAHPEWIANSDQEYIEKAVELASDRLRLAQIRRRLREDLLTSPLCDGLGFAQRVEQQYHRMWQQWCAKQTVNNATLVSAF